MGKVINILLSIVIFIVIISAISIFANKLRRNKPISEPYKTRESASEEEEEEESKPTINKIENSLDYLPEGAKKILDASSLGLGKKIINIGSNDEDNETDTENNESDSDSNDSEDINYDKTKNIIRTLPPSQEPIETRKPVTERPITERPVTERPVYTERPVPTERPINTERPVNTERPITEIPINTERPVNTEIPLNNKGIQDKLDELDKKINDGIEEIKRTLTQPPLEETSVSSNNKNPKKCSNTPLLKKGIQAIKKNFNELVIDHFISKPGKMDPSIEKDIGDMRTYIDWLLHHQEDYSQGNKIEQVHHEIDQIKLILHKLNIKLNVNTNDNEAKTINKKLNQLNRNLSRVREYGPICSEEEYTPPFELESIPFLPDRNTKAPSKNNRVKEVFNIEQNEFTYDQAPLVCKSYGSKLATLEQVIEAQKKGANWCNYGWSQNQMALFPIQKKFYDELQEGPSEFRDDCGRPGINGGYFPNKELKFGVNCYGYKPQVDPSKIVYVDETTMEENPEIYDQFNFNFHHNSILRDKYERIKNKVENNQVDILPFNQNKWSKISNKKSRYIPDNNYKSVDINSLTKPKCKRNN